MNYAEAFVKHAKKELPKWQFQRLHHKAHSAAGGAAPHVSTPGLTFTEPAPPQPVQKRALAADAAAMELAGSMDALGVGEEWEAIEAALQTVVALSVPTDDKAPWLELVQKRAGGRGLPIVDTANMRQVAYCVGLEPDTFDFNGDTMTADEIMKSAHQWYAKGPQGHLIGSEHTTRINAMPVESYIAPQDLVYEGQNGRQLVKKGSWVLGIKVSDAAEWGKVMDGTYKGISVGGWGSRRDA